MIDKIIAFSVKNKLFISIFMLLWIIAGVYALKKVPIDAVPDITNNQVQVITTTPNLGAVEMEQFVTYPVELGLANLPGVEEIRSISRFGLSSVTIVFDEDMGTYLPRQLVAEKLSEVKGEIPSKFGEPFMAPISTGLGEIYQYVLEVDPTVEQQYDVQELRTLQDWVVKRQMSLVEGVVEVNSVGGNIKQYEVAVDPARLKSMGISLTELFEVLENNNENSGAAYIEKNHQAQFIRGEGLIQTVDDIKNIVVKSENNVPIRIGDLADVRLGNAIRYGAFTHNGKEAVGGLVMMLKGENSAEVIERVRDRVVQINKSLPEGINIKPFHDRADLIGLTTSTVRNNLLEGGLIVIFVLVLLLGNFRGGLIVATTIPLSLLFAFILMNQFGVWANLMSLGAIDFGIIVDGAVIIVESSVFYFMQYIKKRGQAPTEEERQEITKTSAGKMMRSAFFGQLIILIVFVPILVLTGVEGKTFKPMALTFIFAMIGAMLLCLTYVPMITSVFLKVPLNGKLTWGDKFIHWLEEKYESLLGKLLSKGKLLIPIAVALFAFSGWQFSRLGGEFMPQLDEGSLAIQALLKPGSSLSETIDATNKIENILLEQFPEITDVIARIGVSEIPTDPMPMDIADMTIVLTPKDEWVSAESKEELMAKIEHAIAVLPGVNFEFSQPIQLRFNELLTGIRQDVAVKIYGEDTDLLAAKAEEVGALISGIEGVGDLRIEATKGLPQINVKYNRGQLARYGVNVSELNEVLQMAFSGQSAGTVFEGERRFDLVIRLKEELRDNLENIKNLFVTIPDGSQIPIDELAEIEVKPGPMQISRDATNRWTYVGINTRGRDIESLVDEIKEKLDANLELPSGYFITYGGAFENLQRAKDRLSIVVPIALILIFILLYFALNSFKQALMIFGAIPLAAIGGVWALWARDMTFSISAGIGFIVLFGVAVLNGLVLISSMNALKQEGVTDLTSRILKGTKERIRPVFLTASTDILGFLPMAISTSAGAEVQQPLATVVIGGLITSTLLTLIILPIVYKWVEQRDRKTQTVNASVVAVAVIGLFIPAMSMGQNQLSLEECLVLAKENYPSIKAAQFSVEQKRKLKKTAWQLGTTQVFIGAEEQGKGQDGTESIGLGQSNINPFGIAANRKWAEADVEVEEANLELTEKRLFAQVKEAYYWTSLQYENVELLSEMDSLYQQAMIIADVRLETGEINQIEFLSIQNKVLAIGLQKQEVLSFYAIAQWQLASLVGVNEPVIPEVVEEYELKLALDSNWKNNPELKVLEEQYQLEVANWKRSKTSLMPQLNAQYTIQSVDGQSGFNGYQAGISIPLWFLPNQGRIQATKLQTQIAKENIAVKELELQSRSQGMLNRLKYLDQSIKYYNSNLLVQANKMVEVGNVAYQAGEIDYLAYLKVMEEATAIQTDYLKAKNNYYTTLIQWDYLIGKE